MDFAANYSASINNNWLNCLLKLWNLERYLKYHNLNIMRYAIKTMRLLETTYSRSEREHQIKTYELDLDKIWPKN